MLTWLVRLLAWLRVSTADMVMLPAWIERTFTEPVVMGEKLDIQYFSVKKAFQKKIGHRQRYTQVKVTAIAG